MDIYDRQHLLAEQNFLREQLEDIPASARLTRMSTQARLRSIEAQLAEIPVEDRERTPAPSLDANTPAECVMLEHSHAKTTS